MPFASAGGTLIDDASHATHGLTGAQVREVVYLSLQHAILRTTDAEGHVQLDRFDIDGAVRRVAAKKDAGLGFHAQVANE